METVCVCVCKVRVRVGVGGYIQEDNCLTCRKIIGFHLEGLAA